MRWKQETFVRFPTFSDEFFRCIQRKSPKSGSDCMELIPGLLEQNNDLKKIAPINRF